MTTKESVIIGLATKVRGLAKDASITPEVLILTVLEEAVCMDDIIRLVDKCEDHVKEMTTQVNNEL